jgi:hypothetical protein
MTTATNTTKQIYQVSLVLLVNPWRDIESVNPETKTVIFNVLASSEYEAIKDAKKLETSDLSIYESYATELND